MLPVLSLSLLLRGSSRPLGHRCPMDFCLKPLLLSVLVQIFFRLSCLLWFFLRTWIFFVRSRARGKVPVSVSSFPASRPRGGLAECGAPQRLPTVEGSCRALRSVRGASGGPGGGAWGHQGADRADTRDSSGATSCARCTAPPGDAHPESLGPSPELLACPRAARTGSPRGQCQARPS